MNKDIRTIVRGVYDLQKLRIQMGNRIVGNFKAKLGQTPGKTEDETLDDDAVEVLDLLRKEWSKIADGIALSIQVKKTLTAKLESGGVSFTPEEELILQAEQVKKLKKESKKLLQPGIEFGEVISSYSEFVLVSQYIDMERREAAQFSQLELILQQEPIYTEFLVKVKGCGPAMSGVIMSEFDIHRSQYPSSMWKYAGLDVAMHIDPDTQQEHWEGRSKKKHHLVDKAYTDRDGKEAVRLGITFNPWLKTKLLGVLGASFLRAGRENNPYADIYYNYKARLQNSPQHQEKSKGHIHNMSIRYMVKRFIVDLYNAWRPLEGLAVEPEYSADKLGIQHRKAA